MRKRDPIKKGEQKRKRKREEWRDFFLSLNPIATGKVCNNCC